MSVKQAIYTISDAPYAPMALILFESLRPFYRQDTDFYLFIIGTGTIKKVGDDINVVYIGDVLDDLDLSQRLVHYLQVELTTSVRPQCFQHLFQRGYDRVVYIDPDVYVFRRMTEVDELLRADDTNGVVTPHAHRSAGPNNVFGGDHVFLQCGIFNLGFLALKNSPETSRMLDWWGEKLKWKCVIDWSRGYFVDQKWLEFLPVYFVGFHILRLPTYNLAPWNSEHHEVLAGPEDTFFLDSLDSPIAFIHFSGIKRANSQFKYMWQAYLFYSKKLAEIRFVQLDFVNYEYRLKPSDLPMDRVCTFLYKIYVEHTGDTRGNPLVDGGFSSYLRSVDGETGLPVYIKSLYEMLPDVFVGYLDTKLPITFDNLIAQIESNFNYDHIVSLETMCQLRGETIRGHRYNISESAASIQTGLSKSSYLTTILAFCKNGIREDDIASEVTFKPGRIEITRSPIRICIPDIAEFGDVCDAEDLLAQNYTEIWVPSNYVKQRLIKQYGFQNITPIPYGVVMPQYELVPTHLPNDKFTVLLRHDFHCDFSAQNPLAGVSAFEEAFGSRDDVLMICFLSNIERGAEYNQLISATTGKANILVVEETPEATYYSHIHHAHCLISLHQRITFGFALAEAMRMGKFVVAAMNGGNADFMKEDTTFLIDCSLPHAGVSDAAKALLTIQNDVDVLSSKSKDAKRYVQKYLSVSYISYIMLRRFEGLYHIVKLEEAAAEAAKKAAEAVENTPFSRRVYASIMLRLARYEGLNKLYLMLQRVKAAIKNDEPPINVVVETVEDPQTKLVLSILSKRVNRPAILD